MATIDAGRRRRRETQFLIESFNHADTCFKLVCHLAQLFHCSHVLDEYSLLHELSLHACTGSQPATNVPWKIRNLKSVLLKLKKLVKAE